MANSFSFLGKDRGGREKWNKLLSGLKRFTCAHVSPAKSYCYLLPVHIDLCEKQAVLWASVPLQGPPTEWTPCQQSQRNKGTAKAPFQPQNESPREEAHHWELWEASRDIIHMDKERKKGEKKPPKTKPHNHRTIQHLVKSSNSSHQCDSVLQQVLVLPLPQQRQRNLLTSYLPK